MSNCPKCDMPLSKIGSHILVTPHGDLHGVNCPEHIFPWDEEGFYTVSAKFIYENRPLSFDELADKGDALPIKQDAAIKEALEIINDRN